MNNEMYQGYIKLWRKQKDWYGMGSSARIALWITLLMEANHKVTRKLFKGKIIDVKPGQLLIGRRHLNRLSGVSQTHIERLLKEFQNERQIIQQTSNKNRLITIKNWDKYQSKCDSKWYSRSDSRSDNRRTTEGQQKDTPKNDKNEKNIYNIYSSPKQKRITAPFSDEDFIQSLKNNPSYRHIDINYELGKIDAWLSVHKGRKKTRRFIINWLNKIDKPLSLEKRKVQDREKDPCNLKEKIDNWNKEKRFQGTKHG